MKHDFEKAQRGAVLESAGKTRVTMYLDNHVLEFFRDLATKNGRGYQTEINAALQDVVAGGSVKSDNFQTYEIVRLASEVESINLRMAELLRQSASAVEVRVVTGEERGKRAMQGFTGAHAPK